MTLRVFRRWALAMLATAAMGSQARADDSTAAFVQGGIEFTKSDGIDMVTEELFLSTKEVRVDFRFHNATDHDLSVIVAFPMPEIALHGMSPMYLSIPSPDARNFMDFKTWVDGQPVQAEIEQKAWKNGVDQSAYLKKLGLPLAPQQEATITALNQLPVKDKQEMVRLGLAIFDKYADNQKKGWDRYLLPDWSLKTIYFWRQTFPAGRDLTVKHRYKPSVGSYNTDIGNDHVDLPGSKYQRETDAELLEYQKTYCFDSAFIAALRRIWKPVEGGEMGAEHLQYVLKTGGNWRKPIGDFRLVIDKGNPKYLMSLCADGLKKISPTQFEMRKTNWRPDRDLDIFFFEP